MGYYINPKDCSKELFLKTHGTTISLREAKDTDWWAADCDSLVVCLVDNIEFTAAGICYSKSELGAFTYYDGREKTFFKVPKERLRPFLPDGIIARLTATAG